jgi:hypothetical protein
MTAITVTVHDLNVLGGTDPRKGAAITVAPYAPLFLGSTLVNTEPSRLPLVAGGGTLNVPASPAGTAYKITPENIPGTPRSWVVVVPNIATITLRDLVARYQVDPRTLDPIAVPEAAWWATVNGLMSRLAALEAGGGGGGTDPTPTRTYDIVAILGQSNAQGAAVNFTPGVSPDVVPSNVYQYGALANVPREGAGTITAASDPLIHRWTQTGITMGPGIPFAREYVKTMAAGRSLLLVPAAYSGTGFTKTNHGNELSTHWRPDDNTGVNLYTSAIQQILAAVSAAGVGARLVGILWVQGEADEAMAPATYEGFLLALIDGLRAALNAPAVPFVIGGMVPEGLAAVPGRKLIDTVQRGIPAKRAYTAYAEGISGQQIDSGLHYNAAGQRALGASMRESLVDALANVPALPGQVAGLKYDAVGSKSVALEWSPVTGATGYRVEFKLAADTSAGWTVSQTVTGTSATVSGRAASTTYSFRVTALNGSGAGSASAAVNATTTAAGAVLSDITAQARRAYGVRRLHASYTGPAIRVRRSSDNTEADIGFTASGDLDEAALLAHVGTGNGFVTKRYDLTGHGLTISQASTTAQARIVFGGVVDKTNGRPALIANVNTFYSGTFTHTSMYASGQSTVCSVVAGTATANGRYMAETSSTNVSPTYAPIMSSNANAAMLSQRITDDAGGSILADIGTVAAFSAAAVQISAVDLGDQWGKKVNGADGGTVSFTRAGKVTLDTFVIGGLFRAGAFGAGIGIRMLEDVVFLSAILLTDRQAVESSQKAYWGTP